MKRFTLTLLVLALASSPLHAGTKVSALSAKPSPSPADYFPVIDKAAHDATPNAPNAYMLTLEQLRTFIGASSGATIPATVQILKGDGTGNAAAASAADIDAAINSSVAPLWSNVGSKPTTAAGFNITNGATINQWGAISTTAPNFATSVTTPKHIYTGNVFDGAGSGSPEGTVSADVGSTYRRTDGGANTTFYRKESGTGNTGWVASSNATGGSPPTGTGFRHVTSGSEDGTAALVGNSDVASNAGIALTKLSFADTALSGGTTLTLGTRYYDNFSSARTLTFSGSPSSVLPPTVLLLNVTTAATLTFPPSIRVGSPSASTITTLALPVGPQVLSWTYSNGAYYLADTVTDPITAQTGDIVTALVTLGFMSGSPTLSGSEILFTDVTTNNASTSAHGFMPKGDGNTGHFYRSDGTQAAPIKAIRTITVVATGTITAGKMSGYATVPFTGQISGWDFSVDAGTATMTVWKIANGTAKPTVSNLINTSGVSISTGTHIHSTTTTDFTSTAVTAGDTLAFALTSVSGVSDLTFQLEIQP